MVFFFWGGVGGGGEESNNLFRGRHIEPSGMVPSSQEDVIPHITVSALRFDRVSGSPFPP